ncbi:hypothetical protein CFC21_034695 [Triticum aestivum]|uniref:RCHY1 zinc-ribbon domain-containing protein n=3 Tax=Triticum TaxID=4564 RepID=A0A9R0RFR9_TRITD|nr:uncharacterized protein LOC119267581 [Triticum dicoccoides]XP_044339451.1 uncharacterized protein LOC123060696 [Triticum aestivum]KAF7021805.1 hypothetical protein CFC21_034695 [Triticum aestivum]VAH59028.1 unnamed protein product [Triticum turgidum subsp. durum]
MTVYFGMLDGLLAAEELPEEYRNRCQDILCNDCGKKGFLGSTGCITNAPPVARTTPELSRPRHQIVPCRINRSADEDVDEDEVEPLPGAISFWRLFNFVDGLDWALMAAGTVAAAAHDAAFVVYMH